MRPVNIALLKAQLSKFLRFVKKGEELLIMDRNQIIAKIVPYNNLAEVQVIKPQDDLANFFSKNKPIRPKSKTNVVQELDKERGDH